MNKEELDKLFKDFNESLDSISKKEWLKEHPSLPRITHAAVWIYDIKQQKDIIIPCHRHCDAFYILKEFGYKKNIDYKEKAQGFLDSKNNFLTRHAAYARACLTDQLLELESEYKELYSEDLW